MLTMLKLAASYALAKNSGGDLRRYRLGAVGVRADGAIVHSRNGSNSEPTPASHAEARLCSRLDRNAVVYVARVSRSGGEFANARPCPRCLAVLRAHQVRKAYYTISASEYGVIEP